MTNIHNVEIIKAVMSEREGLRLTFRGNSEWIEIMDFSIKKSQSIMRAFGAEAIHELVGKWCVLDAVPGTSAIYYIGPLSMPLGVVQVDVREVQELKTRLAEINKPLLSELEFIQSASRIAIPKAVIDWWELTGLNNVDFITALLEGHHIDWSDGWRERFLATLSEDKGDLSE